MGILLCVGGGGEEMSKLQIDQCIGQTDHQNKINDLIKVINETCQICYAGKLLNPKKIISFNEWLKMSR